MIKWLIGTVFSFDRRQGQSGCCDVRSHCKHAESFTIFDHWTDFRTHLQHHFASENHCHCLRKLVLGAEDIQCLGCRRRGVCGRRRFCLCALFGEERQMRMSSRTMFVPRIVSDIKWMLFYPRDHPMTQTHVDRISGLAMSLKEPHGKTRNVKE